MHSYGGGAGTIAENRHVMMQMKKGSGKISRDARLQGAFENSGFGWPTHQEKDFSRRKNVGHAKSKAVIRLTLEYGEHRMFLGLSSEFGNVGAGNQFIIRLIHRYVTIEAQAQDTNVNRAVFCEPS